MDNKNILIADDDKEILSLYEQLFDEFNYLQRDDADENYKIKTFEDGIYLLDYFQNEYKKGNKVPLCILDMKMNLLDGLRTARLLRQVEPDMIIVIITAYLDEISFDTIKENLKNDIYYIKKPFNQKEFYCLVDSLIKGWNKKEELKKNEETYRRMFESFQDLYCCTDMNGIITLITPSVVSHCGYNINELKGNSILKLYSDPEEYDRLLEELKKSTVNGYEVKFLTKDGKAIYMSVNAQIIYDGTLSVPLSIQTIYHNITARKRSEEELIKYRFHLEEMVKERTRELQRLNKKLEEKILEHINSEEKVRYSLQEKEILLKEIHHRIKNNLQIISSLLYLQSDSITDKDDREKIRDSQSRVKSIAIVHEKLYTSKDLSKIDFYEYVESLVSYLLSTYSINKDSIKVKIKMKNIYLDIERAIPCSLIINELVTNSLKYAFPEGKGEIYIEMCRKDDKYMLKVKDNGRGLPGDLDPENIKTLGLELVFNLSEQIEGTVEILRDTGTVFKIIFPSL
jgi:PAS domain S-box-containing protein